jgi:hypothetical protein
MDGYYTKISGQPGSHFFATLKANATPVKVSISNCFASAEERRGKLLRIAALAVIRPQLEHFKRSSFGIPPRLLTCPISDETFNGTQAKVEHVSPLFDEIWAEFLDEMGLEEDDVKLKDGYTSDAFDIRLRTLWSEYHRQRTSTPGALRVVKKRTKLFSRKKKEES